MSATSYRENQELKKFVLKDVKRTGKSLGFGSFGSVEEITIGGTYYAGKKLHNSLLDDKNVARSQLLERMVTECKLMSELRHPNIVQFIGICFFDDYHYPVLVMEKLATNLDDLLVKKANLSLAEKLYILHDITKGLVYLHGRCPPIIHRDLTTRNVLINSASMQAKIADLGNALMINPTTISSMLSQTPGTLVYMPPEATPLNPKYDSSLDMFSFGQLALHTIIQVFPVNLLPSTYEDPETEQLRARSEVERRQQYFGMLYDILSKKHILCRIIKQCLSNKSSDRPAASKVVEILEDCLGKPNIIENSSNSEGHASTARPGDEYLKLYQSRIEQIQRGTPGILEIYRSHGNYRKRSAWKQYVFQISNIQSSPTPHLTFFKSNQEGTPIDQLQLCEVHTVRATATPIPNDDTSKFCFVALSNDKIWLLRAYTQEDCVCWMEAIKSGCGVNIPKKTPPDPFMDTPFREPPWYSQLVHAYSSHVTVPPSPPRPGPKPGGLRHHNSTEAVPTHHHQSSSSADSVEEIYDDTVDYQEPQVANKSRQDASSSTNIHTSKIAQRYEMSNMPQSSSPPRRNRKPPVPPPVKQRSGDLGSPIRKAISHPSLLDTPQSEAPPKPARRTRVARTSLPSQDAAVSNSNRKPLINEDQYETMQGGSDVERMHQPPKKSPYIEPTRRIISPRNNLLKKPPLPSVPPPPDTDDSYQQEEENEYEELDDIIRKVTELESSQKQPKNYDSNQELLKTMQPFEYVDFTPKDRVRKTQPPLPPIPQGRPQQETVANKKEKTKGRKISNTDKKSLKPDKEVTKYINVRKDSPTDNEKPYDDTCSIKSQVDELKIKPYVNMFESEFTAAAQRASKPPPRPPKPERKLKPAVPPKPPEGELRKRAVTFSTDLQGPGAKKREESSQQADHKRSVSIGSVSENQLPPRNILRPDRQKLKVKVPVPRPRSQHIMQEGTG